MFIGNELLFRSLILAELVLLAGGNFSLENPESLLMWEVPQPKKLVEKFWLFFIDTDQCSSAPSLCGQRGSWSPMRSAANGLGAAKEDINTWL